MYHRIARCPKGTLVPGHYVSPAAFRRQLKALRWLKFKPIGLAEAVDRLEGANLDESKRVALTFDDGYANFADAAMPLLLEQKVPATVFIVSNLIGATNEWDASKGDVRETLMTAVQIKDAFSKGMTIGSHSTRHQHLTTLSDGDAKAAIVQSKLQLESLIGSRVDYFCYPYGEENESVRRMVGEAGYRAAVATRKRPNVPGVDRYALSRVNIRKDTALPVFLMKLLKASRFA